MVSSETPAGAQARNWLDRKIVLVRLDPAQPRVFYLARLYGTTGAYWEETQAAMSRDGRRVVWATNWGRNLGQERVWVMELAMPQGWESL